MLEQAAPQLRVKRFNVVASNCPLSSLADDVAAVQRTISMQNGPVLLVGHVTSRRCFLQTNGRTKFDITILMPAAPLDPEPDRAE